MTVQNLDQQIVAGFFNQFQNTELEIAFRPDFIQRQEPQEFQRDADGYPILNLMGLIVHPEKRIVLKDGEWATMRTRHPVPKFQHLNNIILLRGTPYGTIALFNRASKYSQRKSNGFVDGPIPHLHTTASFVAATMRYLKRKGLLFQGAWDLKCWIFSPTFAADLEEQATLDRAAGIAVNDGLPKRIRSNHPANMKPHDVESKRRGHPKRVADFQHPSEAQEHPLDIIPCRANGWKGKRYADQTPAERAAGQAMLAKPEEQLTSPGSRAGGHFA